MGWQRVESLTSFQPDDSIIFPVDRFCRAPDLVMLHLAIECSGMHGSVSLLDDSTPIRVQDLRTDLSSVQGFALAVQAVVHRVQLPEFISVTHGPGSFTGLRVGLATAKMLAFAWNLPVVPVDTLQVLATQIVHRHVGPVEIIAVPVINAFRRQVFTSVWRAESTESIVQLAGSRVVDSCIWQSNVVGRLPGQADPLHESVNHPRKTVVAGPGLQAYLPNLQSPENAGVCLDVDISPHANWVGLVGWSDYRAGKRISAAELSANYIRSSAAEEKLNR